MVFRSFVLDMFLTVLALITHLLALSRRLTPQLRFSKSLLFCVLPTMFYLQNGALRGYKRLSLVHCRLEAERKNHLFGGLIKQYWAFLTPVVRLTSSCVFALSELKSYEPS
jgi:hypothetical protein